MYSYRLVNTDNYANMNIWSSSHLERKMQTWKPNARTGCRCAVVTMLPDTGAARSVESRLRQVLALGCSPRLAPAVSEASAPN